MTIAAATRPAAAAEDAAGLETVLVATDLGPTSATAVGRAVVLAAALHARLLVVSVIDVRLLRLPGGRFGARMDQVREERELAAAAVVAEARRAGVHARSLVWEGEAGESIVEAAAAEGADMIVVGTHSRGGVGRFLLGSVSGYVVRHAPVPVLVVRPGTPERLA